MKYKSYVNSSYYYNVYEGAGLSEEKIEKSLIDASRRVDTLTYNRIVRKGFNNLTLFQQEIISEVVCRLADFYENNKEQLESYISSYSINGVSMSFGDVKNLKVIMGVYIPTEIYSLLAQTGLTFRGL